MTGMDNVIEQVRGLERKLTDAGWVVATPVGELSSRDAVLWYSATYTSGEYTVHAFHREKGFGVPRGNIRVRITPALVEHHPAIGEQLAEDLLRATAEVTNDGFAAMLWPRPIWAEFTSEGVTDHRK